MHREESAGIALAAVLGAIWGWWAWKAGAYFGTIFYPGAIVFFGLTTVLLLVAPIGIRLQREIGLALACLGGLGIWTFLSIIWTPARDGAVSDAMQVFAYAAAFVLGLWLCRLLGPRMLLSLAPAGLGAMIAGLITVVVLWNGHDLATYLHDDASLRFPLGYRNANAAFFLIAFWPALTLAFSTSVARWLRPLMLATATLVLELAVLCQSRGSVIAATVAALVYMALCPVRLRAAAYLGLAMVPFAVSLPTLLNVFQEGVPISSSHHLLHSAAGAMAISFVAAAALGAIAVRFETGISISGRAAWRLERGLAVAVAVLALGGSALYAARHGGPADLIDQSVGQFREGGTPELHGQGTRFGTNFGSNRGDFWRVARSVTLDRPATGAGAGSFGFRYVQDRHSHETPSDPHSVEMLMLSELGVPGLLLFGVALLAAGGGAVRSRTRGPRAAALSAAALAAGAYWFTHASFDWFWNYPAVTAPVLGLLGAACAPAALDSRAQLGRGARWAMAALPALLMLVAVPLYLSERYTDDARARWQDDRSRAYDDLSRARSLNPVAERPWLVEAEIARLTGDRARALTALREAIDEQPDNWLPHLRLALVAGAQDPALAARELSRARELNPDSPEVAAAMRFLSLKFQPPPGDRKVKAR